MARLRRIRRHVNPLSHRYLVPRAQPIRPPAQLGPETDVEVELGCADGDFSFGMARARTDVFMVGLDIRERMVAANEREREAEGLANLRFGYVNLNVDLDRVFEASSVRRFHLLFPDPWFKPRHRKRRVMETGMLDVMVSQLRRGGELHFASDVFEVALEAMAELEEHPAFTNLREPWSFWRDNPFPTQSRRERLTRSLGARVWRLRYSLEGEDHSTGTACDDDSEASASISGKKTAPSSS